MLKKITLCFLFIFSNYLIADPKDYYYKRLQSQTHQLQEDKDVSDFADTTIEEYFPQLIDHNNYYSGAFSQRFFVDERYSLSNDSPVFFYICGEAACTKRNLSGSIRSLARKYHAKLVALEHRYYGMSVPGKNLSTENLKHLKTEFALKDLKRFQEELVLSRNWTGKWIAFGGSYPGSLSAYYRLKYPEMVIGALASSAPVMAVEHFDMYDAHVANMAGPECLAKMQQSVKIAEAALIDPSKLAQIKQMFSAEAISDDKDFMYLIADIGAAAVQYGMRDQFCNDLTSAQTPLEGYAKFAQYLYSAWGVNALSFNPQGALDENPATYENDIGIRSWYYQSCTEYGFWQNAYLDPTKSARSSLINLDYHKNVCKRLFNVEYNLDTQKINHEYYLPLLNPDTKNILFTNGSVDPWSFLSISEKLGNNTNPNLDYFMIEGAAHCDDLKIPRKSDSASMQEVRLKLSSLIEKWLK